MDFALSDEQRSLECSVREFLDERFDLARVREYYDARDGGAPVELVPAELWKAAADQGWLSVLVPEQYEGLALGLLDAAVLARALGGGVAPGPVMPTVLVEEAIRLGGDERQQSEWLPRLARGELIAALSLSADHATPGVSSIRIDADRSGRLSGSGGLVEYAEAAELLVVAARDGDGTVALWLVRTDAEGVRVEPADAIDRSTRLARVTLAGAVGERLVCSDSGTREEVLRRGAVLTAADLVGVASRALQITVDYVKTRTQFGQPIGGFQAVKHVLADLHVGIVMAGHGMLYAAHAMDEGQSDAGPAVSIAKAKASDVARAATAAAIQFHGGIGFTWEHDAHMFFKRANREAFQYGDADWHREQVISEVLGPRN